MKHFKSLNRLKNSKREDVALISVQFWLFAISFIAVRFEVESGGSQCDHCIDHL